jgi:putative transposase
VVQGVGPVARKGRNMVGPALTLRYMPARENRNQLVEFRNRDHPQRVATETCPEGIAKLFAASAAGTGRAMQIPSSMPRLKGFRFPREIVAYAVWACHRFVLSTADIEDLLAERGIIVRREAIRLWVNRFGAHFTACIRRDRPRPNDKWHLDEVVIQMGGVKHWLWRAVDDEEDLDLIRGSNPRRTVTRSTSWFRHAAMPKPPSDF